MTSSALVSLPPVYGAPAYPNPPQVNLNSHVTGHDGRELLLAPLTFNDIAPFPHRSSGFQASVPPGSFLDDYLTACQSDLHG